MECYKSNNNDPFGTQSSPTMIRKYPLGAFLTGMRGLDIGCETCISVNSRGMMAIQHQVAKDGYTDTSSANVRPSFVDFIMTCIEDEGDDEELSQENISQGVHQNDAWQNEMNDETEEATTTTSTRNKSKTRTRETFSSSEDEDMQTRTHRRKEKQQYDSASGTDDEGFERSSSSNAASKILGELELDKDMISSHRDDTMQGRKTALEDIRRRRRERQNESMRMDESDNEESAEDENAEKRNDYSNKRRSDSVPKASRKLRRSEGNDSESNQSDDNADSRLQNLRSTEQSSSEDDDDDDSEPEDALDVTAEIPKLFSKSPSMSTSRHGRRRGKSADRDDEAVDEEPKMMYGDTRLEFTQDGYESGDS